MIDELSPEINIHDREKVCRWELISYHREYHGNDHHGNETAIYKPLCSPSKRFPHFHYEKFDKQCIECKRRIVFANGCPIVGIHECKL